MIYRYYNQNNYGHVPYPSSSRPSATVKSGGCGVVCAAMIVSNLTSGTVDPVFMASYSISKGARVDGGTDMDVLAKAICADYGLACKTTNDETELLGHLSLGGMAIANVGGDRTGYTGVFSNEGHYVVAADCYGNSVTVLDPGYYAGKFNLAGRKGKVTVDENQYCHCDISVLGADTANRSPAYWLFSKEDDKLIYKTFNDLPDWAKPTIKKMIDRGSIVGDGKGNINLSEDLVKGFVILAREGLIK